MKNFLMLSLAVGSLCIPINSHAKKLADIQIRDPFIYADTATQTYYLYRSVPVTPEQPRGSVEAYTSRDLKDWEGPVTVLDIYKTNWATGQIWAPEMHVYKGVPYMFVTVNCPIEWKEADTNLGYTMRGTQIFRGESLLGRFRVMPEKLPATPMGQMCLDGTLWVEDGKPYMVYCHEWVETVDGEICLQQLSEDLRHPVGNPVRLFCGSAPSWSDGSVSVPPRPWAGGRKNYVTDGPFLYRSPISGNLFMIWSSFSKGEYAMGYAWSITGRVTGPWKQMEKPLFTRDGGHGMIFTDFKGQPYVVLHSPNQPDGAERAHLYPLLDDGGLGLSIGQ